MQNQIAGVGPFAGVKPVWWTSPAALAELLRPLANGAQAASLCRAASGAPC